MAAALFTVAAVALGVASLGAFGYGAWDVVVILVPMAVGVALFVAAVTCFGLWSVRWLNRVGREGPEPPQEKD